MPYVDEKDIQKTVKLLEAADTNHDSDNRVKRSLGWRLPTLVIVFLTVTVFCLCWVKVTSIESSKDITITRVERGEK